MKNNATPTIRDLYPYLNQSELAQAEDNLDRYLALVQRIFERMELDPQPPPLAPDVGTVSCTPPRSQPSA